MVGDYIPELTGEDAEYFLKQVEENKHIKQSWVCGKEFGKQAMDAVNKLFGCDMFNTHTSDSKNKVNVSTED